MQANRRNVQYNVEDVDIEKSENTGFSLFGFFRGNKNKLSKAEEKQKEIETLLERHIDVNDSYMISYSEFTAFISFAQEHGLVKLTSRLIEAQRKLEQIGGVPIGLN